MRLFRAARRLAALRHDPYAHPRDAGNMIVTIVGGTGAVGTILGARLAAAGHGVAIGARDPASERAVAAVAAVRKAARLPDAVSADGVGEACAKGDLVLLTTPGMPTAEKLRPLVDAMGPCTGKPVVDASNPLTPWPRLEISADRNATSASEELATLLPECGGVFKAFNTVGTNVMEKPVFDGKAAVMLYAGPPESEGKAAFDAVTGIIADVGFDPLYVGGPRQARNLESLGEMWIHMALRYKDLPYHKQVGDSRDFAWSVLYR